MSHTAIALEEVTKSFGKRLALQNVTLEAQAGAVTVLAGPNGAGKSTLLNLVNGLVKPNDGRVTVLGNRAGSRRAVDAVARQFEYPLSGGRLLTGELARLLCFDAIAHKQFRALLARFELDEQQRMGTLSRGNYMRAMLAAVFAGNRPIILLDEPTVGLDVFAAQLLFELIEEAAARNTAVLVATHQPYALSCPVDDLILLDRGALLFAGRPGEEQTAAISSGPEGLAAFIQSLRLKDS